MITQKVLTLVAVRKIDPKAPRLPAWLVVALVAGVWSLAVPPAIAHPELKTTVRHRAEITVGPKNVDVTIELTIGEIPAFAERLLMDDDQDGTITPSEVKAYLAEQADSLQQAVSLTIAGQPADLLFLYDPEIDLMGAESPTAAHLVFRLYYFSRSPRGLKAGDEILLTDRLWSHAPSLGAYHVVGKDGIKMITERDTSVLMSFPKDEKPLEMRARCIAVPTNTSSNEQGDLSRPSMTTSPIVKIKPQATSKPPRILERSLPEPSTTQPPIKWLITLGAIVLIAGAAVVLTRRTQRQRKRKANHETSDHQ